VRTPSCCEPRGFETLCNFTPRKFSHPNWSEARKRIRFDQRLQGDLNLHLHCRCLAQAYVSVNLHSLTSRNLWTTPRH
jgi:hypothetical protein